MCDGDADSDGILDAVDNCSLVSNVSQFDLDYDELGDVCDDDDDNDGNLIIKIMISAIHFASLVAFYAYTHICILQAFTQLSL